MLRTLLRSAMVGLLLGVVVVAVVYFTVGGDSAVEQSKSRLETVYNQYREFRTSSRFARWLRHIPCDEPSASALNPSNVQISYSWTQGYGPGEVHLTVLHGKGTLTLTEWQTEPVVYTAEVPENQIEQILDTARTSGFFCLETEKRKGYQVVDLGKYEITFSTSGYQKTLYVDGHNYVSDGKAFAEVQDAIFALSAVFGHSFDWGPYGISTVPTESD